MIRKRPVVAVILAAGRGTRAASKTPKQFIKFKGRELFFYPLRVYLRHPQVDMVVVVVPKSAHARTRMLCRKWFGKKGDCVHIISGGSLRALSVQKSLHYLIASRQMPDSLVLFQDGVRPFIQKSHIEALLRTAERSGASIIGSRSADPVVYLQEGRVIRMHGRDTGYHVSQSPECYRLGDLVRAHKNSQKRDPRHYTEKTNLEVMIEAGVRIPMILNLGFNPKLTYPADISVFKKLL